MATFKPAYLICGDDHGRIAERRARLRAMAEIQSGASGAELFEGDAATVGAVTEALGAMTLAIGRRFLIVDGVQRWRENEVQSVLAPALAALDPETTVAFFAREEGKTRAPAALRDAVRGVGGEVSEELTVKPWKLAAWVREQAARMNITIDPSAARALVALVGERQQRLMRELERLALDPEVGARITLESVEQLAATSSERRVWTLADALVARDRPGAVRLFLSLDSQGERLPGLLYVIAQRLRLALEVADRLAGGEPAAQVRRTLIMPQRAANRFIADVQGTDADRLQGAIEAVADLELQSRGASQLGEATLALRAIERVAA